MSGWGKIKLMWPGEHNERRGEKCDTTMHLMKFSSILPTLLNFVITN